MNKTCTFENSSDDILINIFNDNNSYNFPLNKLLEHNLEDLFSTKEKSKNEINTEKKNELLKKKKEEGKKMIIIMILILFIQNIKMIISYTN